MNIEHKSFRTNLNLNILYNFPIFLGEMRAVVGKVSHFIIFCFLIKRFSRRFEYDISCRNSLDYRVNDTPYTTIYTEYRYLGLSQEEEVHIL